MLFSPPQAMTIIGAVCKSHLCTLRHLTGNNLPTLLAYLSQILVQLLCCNDSYIVAMKVQFKKQ
ncbi:MAG: hypothetical protein BECKG1743D_GA0114223_113081 [Candidatus Kentron sp. G]|nr:MAG: hypothetical protein BECKG1743D_GA0114223_113081 [Candidatus Kentron sp. G]